MLQLNQPIPLDEAQVFILSVFWMGRCFLKPKESSSKSCQLVTTIDSYVFLLLSKELSRDMHILEMVSLFSIHAESAFTPALTNRPFGDSCVQCSFLALCRLHNRNPWARTWRAAVWWIAGPVLGQHGDFGIMARDFTWFMPVGKKRHFLSISPVILE